MLDADVLKKFERLPQDLKNLISSKEALSFIDRLEQQYDILLAGVLIRVMVKDIPLEEIGAFLMREYGKNAQEASAISHELIDKIFKFRLDYLTKTPKLQDVFTTSKTPAPNTLSIPAAAENSPIRPSLGDIQRSMGETETQSKMSNTGEDFTFGVEEQKEIDRIRRKQEEKVIAVNQSDTQQFIDDLIAAYVLPIENEQQKTRFSHLIISRMKGVRDDFELRDMLISPANVGGMDFPSTIADEILPSVRKRARIEQHEEEQKRDRSEIERTEPQKNLQPQLQAIFHELPPEPRMITEDTSTLEKIYEITENHAQSTPPHNPLEEGWSKTQTTAKPLTLFVAKKAAPPPQLPSQTMPAATTIEEKPQVVGSPSMPFPTRKAKPLPKILPPKAFPSIRRLASEAELKKPKISDIIHPSKAMGLVEELAAFKLKDLRQLSPDPKQVTQTLKGKLELLEEESIIKKSEGIDAWKNSEVNRLYVELGQESLFEGEPIEIIIQKRQSEKQAFLTPEEFSAVADFNRSLRF